MAQIQPNCFECKYHFITHQPKRPYGCRRFGFKGPFLPSRMVFQETGMKCAYFERVINTVDILGEHNQCLTACRGHGVKLRHGAEIDQPSKQQCRDCRHHRA